MEYLKFAFHAQLWMKHVCNELFNSDIFSSSDGFDFLYDYDFNINLAHGFSILSYSSLSMGDFVIVNQICVKYGCFYVVHSFNSGLSIHFYLESHG